MKQVIDQQAVDMIVFTGLTKVPFGENIKEFFLADFRNNPLEWGKVFSEGTGQSLSPEEKQEREELLAGALAKFDLKRAVFDK